MKLLGAVLFVLGCFALLFGSFSDSPQRTTFTLGPITKAIAVQQEFPLAPFVGATCVVGGILLVATARPRRHRRPMHGLEGEQHE